MYLLNGIVTLSDGTEHPAVGTAFLNSNTLKIVVGYTIANLEGDPTARLELDPFTLNGTFIIHLPNGTIVTDTVTYISCP